MPPQRTSATAPPRSVTLAFALTTISFSIFGCAGWQPIGVQANLNERVHDAYHQISQPLPPGPYARHYERGWKQAYVDFTRGSDGSIPSVPPGTHRLDRCSDSSEYRKIAAWYRGYEHGLAGAQCQCRGGLTAGETCIPEPPLRREAINDQVINDQATPRSAVSYQPEMARETTIGIREKRR